MYADDVDSESNGGAGASPSGCERIFPQSETAMQSPQPPNALGGLLLIAAIVVWATSPSKWQTFKTMMLAFVSSHGQVPGVNLSSRFLCSLLGSVEPRRAFLDFCGSLLGVADQRNEVRHTAFLLIRD